MSQQTFLFDYEKGALLSHDKKYRYRLWRIWDKSLPAVLFVMHNPSTADAHQDDPTIRRCINFAKAWGYGGIYVGNVFPYRATDPKELLGLPLEKLAPSRNLESIRSMVMHTKLHVVAYGNPIIEFRIWKEYRHLDWHCLKITSTGNPCHPLYLKKDLKPVPYTFK